MGKGKMDGVESKGSESEMVKPDSVELEVVIRKNIQQKVLK